jgi:hypothetical protein
MRLQSRTIVITAAILAVVVFCVVQDRVTAGGARQYVELQRAAAEGRGNPVTVDQVMGPAVRRSVTQASLWSAVVLFAGAATAAMVRRRGGAR